MLAKSLLYQDFTNDHQTLNSQIDKSIAEGSRGDSNLYGAFKESLAILRAAGANNGITSRNMILLSDGTDEAVVVSESEALMAKGEDVEIFTIGIQGDYDEAKIKALASRERDF